jgi:hypothetical protein
MDSVRRVDQGPSFVPEVLHFGCWNLSREQKPIYTDRDRRSKRGVAERVSLARDLRPSRTWTDSAANAGS